MSGDILTLLKQFDVKTLCPDMTERLKGLRRDMVNTRGSLLLSLHEDGITMAELGALMQMTGANVRVLIETAKRRRRRTESNLTANQETK